MFTGAPPPGKIWTSRMEDQKLPGRGIYSRAVYSRVGIGGEYRGGNVEKWKRPKSKVATGGYSIPRIMQFCCQAQFRRFPPLSAFLPLQQPMWFFDFLIGGSWRDMSDIEDRDSRRHDSRGFFFDEKQVACRANK